MKQTPHPENIYIQISDDSPSTLGFAFTDNIDAPETIDPNAFDEETKKRVITLLYTSFKFFRDKYEKNETIHPL